MRIPGAASSSSSAAAAAGAAVAKAARAAAAAPSPSSRNNGPVVAFCRGRWPSAAAPSDRFRQQQQQQPRRRRLGAGATAESDFWTYKYSPTAAAAVTAALHHRGHVPVVDRFSRGGVRAMGGVTMSAAPILLRRSLLREGAEARRGGASSSSSSSSSSSAAATASSDERREGSSSGAVRAAPVPPMPDVSAAAPPPLRQPAEFVAGMMTWDEIERRVARIFRSDDVGILLSQIAVGEVLQLARAAMKLGAASKEPDRAALLCEKLLLACLSQKQRQLRQARSDQQQHQQNSEAGTTPTTTALHYPPVDLYNLVIMSWGNTKSEAGAQRAQQIFDLLRQSYDGLSLAALTAKATTATTGDDDDSAVQNTAAAAAAERPPRPDRRTYKSLIRAWAVSKSAEGPDRARQLLEAAEELSGIAQLLREHADESGQDIDPSHKSLEPAGAMEGGDHDGGPSEPARTKVVRLQPPDRAMYNTVLSGYASLYASSNPNSSNQPSALERMTEIVDRMDRLREITHSREYRLDPFSYHALLRAHSRRVRSLRHPNDVRKAGREIDELLRRMVRSTNDDDDAAAAAAATIVDSGRSRRRDEDGEAAAARAVPWSWAVGVLVEALAKSGEPRDVHLAVDYLRVLAGRASPHPGMVAPPSFGTPRRRRNEQQHRHHDNPFSSSRGFVTNDVEDYPSQESIWRVIQALERLDSGSNHAARTSSNSSESVRDTIDELVRIAMEAPYERIFFVNQAAEFWIETGWTYAPDLVEQLMAAAWERSRQGRGAAGLKPTGQTFAIAMRAWLRCNRRDEAPHRCELLFQQMLTLHQETTDRYYRPRDEHLRYVINCWLNRCHDGRRYHGLAGYLYPAEHIEAHLQWHIKPGSSASPSAMDDAAQDWIKNAAGHYSMAIRAWSKQIVDDKDNVDVTERAVQLLDELEHIVDRIPAFPCNWALEIFSQPQPGLETRKKAYDAAIDTFRRGERNARTFVLLLKVLKVQVPTMDQDHRDVIEGLVKECCASGMLTQDLIWRAVELLNADSLQRLFGLSYQYASLIVQRREVDLDLETMSWKGMPPSGLLVQNLPQEWSCNIDRQRRVPVSGKSK